MVKVEQPEGSFGIWLEIAADELRTHLTARIDARLAKVAAYRAEIERLGSVPRIDDDGAGEGFALNTSYVPSDPRKAAEARMREHETQARRLKFWRDHLPKQAVFRISPHEASNFELLDE